MTTNDLKQIGHLIDERLEKKLDEKLKPIYKKIEYMDLQFFTVYGKLDSNFEALLNIKTDLNAQVASIRTIQSTQEAHTGSLVDIEKKLDGYADMYKMNQDNVERLDKRMAVVEDELTINPPQELKVQHKNN